MNIAPTIVRNKLKSALNDLDSIKDLFVRNPGVDFSRKRKLPFISMFLHMLKYTDKSLQNEISSCYLPPGSLPVLSPTKSAFIQQRDKILPEAGYVLLRFFTDSLPFMKTYNGYRLLACDGTDVSIPRNEDESDYSVSTRKDRKSYNKLHLNGLFDVMNRVFVDCTVDPGTNINERAALASMVSRLSDPDKAIILADRGYDGFNCIAHLLESNVRFAVRAKDIASTGFLSSLHLPPDSDEFDISVSKKLFYRKPRGLTDDTDYIHLKRHTFDFLDPSSSDVYDISFRVVRVKLSNGSYECIVTNLSPDEFSKDDLRKLYHQRWKIENAYRDLKYSVGLLHFHGKSADAVLLELFCSLVFFNFSAYIAVLCNSLCHSSDTQYSYKVNFAIAVCSCRTYLHDSNSELELLHCFKHSSTPIRPNRQVRRGRIREQPSREFYYRQA